LRRVADPAADIHRACWRAPVRLCRRGAAVSGFKRGDVAQLLGYWKRRVMWAIAFVLASPLLAVAAFVLAIVVALVLLLTPHPAVAEMALAVSTPHFHCQSCDASFPIGEANFRTVHVTEEFWGARTTSEARIELCRDCGSENIREYVPCRDCSAPPIDGTDLCSHCLEIDEAHWDGIVQQIRAREQGEAA
ncbi:MAG: hypothetical protein ACRD3Q_18595, partial [Terriglobales bacterium]